MMQIKVNKFSDILKLIEDYNLNDSQIETLLKNTVGIYTGKKVPQKEKLLKQLNEYWEKYKDFKERPLFLGS